MPRAGIDARFRIAFPAFRLDIDCALPGKGVTALFGPSGSGKTTVLRCIAGLTRAEEGRLTVGDEVWQDDSRGIFVPASRRPVGVVFQEASLFSHLSVIGNLRYGMTRAGLTPEAAGFDTILALLGLGGLLHRATSHLSGGERQRVAIARALLRRPHLLLMDEPLAAIDLRRKAEILPYLERLRDELNIPILYVSHSPDEVARLADYLVLLEEGHIVAQGAMSEMMSRMDLASHFADDVAVVWTVSVGAQEVDDLTRLDFTGGSILVGRRPEAPGTRLRCRIHARDVSLSLSRHSDISIANILPATVAVIGEMPTPGHVLIELALHGSEKLVARLTRRSCAHLGLRPGLAVWAQVKAVALMGD